MNILWHDSAVFELEKAALHYSGVDDELGLRFIAAAEIAITQIKRRPQMSREFDGDRSAGCAARKLRLQALQISMADTFPTEG